MKAIIFRCSVWSLFLFCMLFMSSCVDLNVAPTDKYTDDTYWTSEANASAILNMAYRQMNSSDWVFRDERLSDNLYNGYGGDAVKNISNGQATSSTVLFNEVWNSVYSGIKTTHTLLANIDRVMMDEDRKNRMKAEARFIRALLFFQATNWYGNIPFFTKDIDEATARAISPTPQSEVLSWIHQELEEIAEILPNKEEYTQENRGRITAGAAMAMNARIALNFNEWEKVVQYTDKLIHTGEYGKYTLFPDYQKLFFKENEYNSEIILDIQYVPEKRTWNNMSVYVPFSLPLVQYILACPTQSLVDTYLMKDGSKWDESKGAYDNRDPRFDMTIIHHGSSITDKEGNALTVNVDPNDPKNNTRDKIGRENGGQTGYFYRKYYDTSQEAWTVGTSWNCNTNLITLRFADVLLMYAEAKYELGEMNPEVWNKTIKLLRQRAGFDSTPAAIDYPITGDLRQIIRNERRVELALEGTRIYDIRRWKIAETVLNEPVRGAKFKLNQGNLEYFSYNDKSFDKERDYLWAIPRQQLVINPNLGQNPGY